MKNSEVLELLAKAQKATARADRSDILKRLIDALLENKHRTASRQPKGCIGCLRSLMTGLFWQSLDDSPNALILCAPLFLMLCCESGMDLKEYQQFLVEQSKTLKN